MEESDRGEVPMNQPNKGAQALAEAGGEGCGSRRTLGSHTRNRHRTDNACHRG